MLETDVVRTKKKIGGVDNKGIDNIQASWWRLEDDTLFSSVFSVVNSMRENQSYRRLQNEKFERLYGNFQMLGFSSRFNTNRNMDKFAVNAVTLNVVKSACDTLAAKISSKKPQPLFQTDDGDFKIQRRAKYLTQYISGVFDSCGVYETGQDCFLDSLVLGSGIMHVFIDQDEKEIACERVFIDELLVDDQEAKYGKPRQIHRCKLVSRDVALELYPDFETEIMNATVGSESIEDYRTTADDIMIIESWHLPSSKKSADGRHTICIDNATLLSEPYKKNYFPFVKLDRGKRFGYWGSGLAEELSGIQFEINNVLKTISKAHQLIAVPRVYVDSTSNVNTKTITNEVGGIVKYSGGNPPIFQTATGMNPETYNYVDSLYKKAYEISGISQLSAASVKPAGLDSAVALREYSDQTTERWLLTAQRYENFFLQIAKIVVDLSKDLYADNPELKIKATNPYTNGVKGGKFLGQIDWKDCDLSEDKYTMELFAVSPLPSTPAGKLSMIQELVQAGMMDKDVALSLLDFPDLDRFMSLKNAAIDDAEMVIGQILEDGECSEPDPYMNLGLTLRLAQSSYLRAKTQKGVKENNMELLRKFIDRCQDLMSAPTAPAPSNSAQPGMAPQSASQPDLTGQASAQGAPQAVSQLLPAQGTPLQA
jgi:hypothetical protein